MRQRAVCFAKHGGGFEPVLSQRTWRNDPCNTWNLGAHRQIPPVLSSTSIIFATGIEVEHSSYVVVFNVKRCLVGNIMKYQISFALMVCTSKSEAPSHNARLHRQLTAIRTLRKGFATTHGGAKQQLTCLSFLADPSKTHHMLVATEFHTNLAYNNRGLHL